MKPTGQRQMGFTLVEAIVIAVIMATLAAVGVPILISYLETARKNTARSQCELIAAAISHNHSRGISISASPTGWAQIGISNPSDQTWAYSFPAPPVNLYGSAYAITATRVGKGTTGTFQAFLQPSPIWTGDLK